ncbi:hypothetical protein D4764_17G0001890 [Takifugu flavidus]|uniref:Uncharacterized protein n=1 Tax=Takifugu flavidus TaxID=433684 RepID=A0A5C6NUN7_9TELE|nr:hypothetical protein D4764_17G0001890 [Takifugu flavidus]
MRRINERRAGAAQKRGGAGASVHGGAQPRCQIASGGGLECSGWEKGGGIGVNRGRGGESRTRERERPASRNQTISSACVPHEEEDRKGQLRENDGHFSQSPISCPIAKAAHVNSRRRGKLSPSQPRRAEMGLGTANRFQSGREEREELESKRALGRLSSLAGRGAEDRESNREEERWKEQGRRTSCDWFGFGDCTKWT